MSTAWGMYFLFVLIRAEKGHAEIRAKRCNMTLKAIYIKASEMRFITLKQLMRIVETLVR